MKVSRLMLFGGMIGGTAAWAYLATEGLISAAGLIIGVFTVLVIGGAALADMTDGVGRRTASSVVRSVRSFRHRHAAGAICGVCARPAFNNGVASFCTSCDRIPAVVIA